LHALDEALALAAFRGQVAGDLQDREWLADLDADGAVAVGYDVLERGVAEGSVVEVETARAGAGGLDWRLDVEAVDLAEVDEADAAGAVGRHRRLRDPAVHLAPVVEHHVVLAVARDRSAVDDLRRRSRTRHR
jgi:hypothetical protein